MSTVKKPKVFDQAVWDNLAAAIPPILVACESKAKSLLANLQSSNVEEQKRVVHELFHEVHTKWFVPVKTTSPPGWNNKSNNTFAIPYLLLCLANKFVGLKAADATSLYKLGDWDRLDLNSGNARTHRWFRESE